MRKIFYYYFGGVIIYLPFASLLQALLAANTHLSENSIFWISHWYEIILAPMVIYALVSLIWQRKCPGKRLFKPAAVFVIFALMAALFWSGSASVGLEGYMASRLP